MDGSQCHDCIEKTQRLCRGCCGGYCIIHNEGSTATFGAHAADGSSATCDSEEIPPSVEISMFETQRPKGDVAIAFFHAQHQYRHISFPSLFFSFFPSPLALEQPTPLRILFRLSLEILTVPLSCSAQWIWQRRFFSGVE
ncbi:hypothetical protein SODALDRAFT_25535 [Sodiomyces alkalinus F11]|uniref:Uncharacterized protein n=1 Tax=Sodiomyces alkalinus (strain CBS 110278 / VKM F-3762 / F11) TaxID=1314773 RepID=A0A3N2Q7W9_SODAK|nr:hypothetical protein SODALDRAFT_25535 [Sodiomyces alkalinus F11]ROT42869.1 hypothetical protein SODALDRAFT_25535 [Sodiomyces alkalinus F11]